MMSGANIRHHLSVMKTYNLVESVSQLGTGRGRPVHVYRLSRQILGDGIEDLIRAIFDALFKTVSDEVLEANLRSIALCLGGKNLPHGDFFLPKQLNRVIDRLNELHYEARWEAGVNGPHVILGHCPFASIIAACPELCRMDSLFLEQFIGLSVDQTAKLQPSIKGYPFCSFLVSYG
jgi:predicted ArsR family transcriptional regulator